MAGPSQFQALILWALVARGGEAPQNGLKPQPDKKVRDGIVGLGLIRTVPGPRRSIILELTDQGWAWAAANFSAPLSGKSNAGTVVLADFLRRLEAFLAARDVSLAEFIRPAPAVSAPAGSAPQAAGAASGPAAAANVPTVAGNLPERIRAAYLDVTGGAVKRGVRLAALQARLPDVAPDALHRALLKMQAEGGAGLLQQEDPTKLTAEDHAAVLRVGGAPRHLVWLD